MDHPVQVTDWMPTFTALVGAEPKQDPLYDGQDIWPLITGEKDSPSPRRLFWNFRQGRDLGIRYGDWKLTACGADGNRTYELFNVADDPYEQHERASEYPDKVEDLAGRIEEERQQDDSAVRKDVGQTR
jgi:arylsulfatase A-like enzyme